MKNNLDEKLKQALGKPCKLDIEKFSARVMKKIKEEKRREEKHPLIWSLSSRIRSYLIIKQRQLLRISYAFITIVVVVILLVIFFKGVKKESTIYVASNGKNMLQPTSAPQNLNHILLSTDTDTILLTGEQHLISNDPLLRPHSAWAQNTLNKSLSLNNS
jgi:hypothetical protein